MAAIDVLMFHSISDAGGPTSIAPEVFRAQMEALAASGRPVVGIDMLVDKSAPEDAVVLTFDDGFEDFAVAAFPVLKDLNFESIVYVPTGLMGGMEDWSGANAPARPLMDWDVVDQLAGQGVAFGSHTITHPDLSKLDEVTRDEEVMTSKTALEARLGTDVVHFAAPYGRSNWMTDRTIRSVYKSNVTTRFDQHHVANGPFDIPRIEMFYYTDLARWTAHLAGDGASYMKQKQLLRSIRQRVSGLWGGR